MEAAKFVFTFKIQKQPIQGWESVYGLKRFTTVRSAIKMAVRAAAIYRAEILITVEDSPGTYVHAPALTNSGVLLTPN